MNYEKIMEKCIELARQGEGNVSPNPLAGCVVLDKNGNIISSGFHRRYGGNHAEREALLKLSNNEACGGTLVVNLEPCSHYGKTPPCADLIIEKGIRRVVIGMRDVNPIVNGSGMKKLEAAGIEVVENVLYEKCLNLNEIFVKNMTQKKTFAAIKTAVTLDGKIAAEGGNSKWITSGAARNEVVKIRNRYDAILTSSATVIADNPSMTHKKKVIIDRRLKTDFLNANIYSDGEKFVFYDEDISLEDGIIPDKKLLADKNISLYPVPAPENKIDLKSVMDKLYDLGVMSVLIEAGGKLNGSALEFCDKIYEFIAPKILGDNKGLSCFDFRNAGSIDDSDIYKIEQVEMFPPDILLTLKK